MAHRIGSLLWSPIQLEEPKPIVLPESPRSDFAPGVGLFHPPANLGRLPAATSDPFHLRRERESQREREEVSPWARWPTHHRPREDRGYFSIRKACNGITALTEPLVSLNVGGGGKPVDFLIDTGATFSVLQHLTGPGSKDRTLIQGATGRGGICSANSRPQFSFEGGEPQVLLRGPTDQEKTILLLTCPLQEEYRLHEGPSEAPPQDPYLGRLREEIPGVWVEGNLPRLAAHRPPILIQLTSMATPVRVRQYPMSQKVKIGIAKHILRLREAGILIPCQSAWNTPLIPIQKPGTEDFRPVQDLREVNKRVETIHPTVPNPYTLVSLLRLSTDIIWS
ncbi:hypothetical protein QTO34_003862 [Cnephaeus nilssonii]|uniref:Peptidase A2 domain-containing protein n=1 Tax=Cnephaeus nilssonii TaxID=3371016 RepID=A0AA40LKZ9_CNENI|nr:hypothetical protein QTO34_003862 [Eptesicus nilssonii]